MTDFQFKATDSLAALTQSCVHQIDLEGLEKKALAMAAVCCCCPRSMGQKKVRLKILAITAFALVGSEL